MDVSVITIFFKEEKELLVRFLTSVYKSAGNLFIEVIIANNSNEDLDYLAKEFSDIHIINNKENKGVASSRNQAYLRSQGKLLLFMDSDIVVEAKAIEQMYAYLTANLSVGALGAKIVYPDGSLQHSFGSLPAPAFLFYEMLNISPPSYNREASLQEVDFISGGTLMVRRDIWEKVGPLDEKFFPYGWEDADWCLRAKAKGIKLCYFPQAKWVHFLHKSATQTGARQVEYYLCGIYYYRKHFGKFFASLAAVFIVGFSSLRVLVTFIKPKRSQLRRQLLKLIKAVITGKV